MADLLSSWEETGDRRRIFLDCYSRMTRNMLEGVAEGRFEDADWVAGLLHHFADYYFKALESYDRDDPSTPLVWHHTFTAASSDGTTPLQHLLLGVNAHINFDLVFALADVLEPSCAAGDEHLVRKRYRDHRLVNTIIGETVDEVQDEVIEKHSPSLDLLDKLGGPVDEWLTSRLISAWRDEVWRASLSRLACACHEDGAKIRAEVERRAIERARLLLLF
jgi:hypothetical protein